MKLCECGCGKPTPLATKTNRKHGLVKGQPTRFLRSHSLRGKNKPPCSVEGCNREPHARGWCTKHWNRWRVHGDPLGMHERSKDAATRFWAKVDVGHPLGCWLWTAADNGHGYGAFNVGGGKIVKAHRYAYELLMGPIPDGLTLDHLCRNPPCVNPDHLEPVTVGVNSLRGYSPPSKNARKNNCPQGHPYTLENTRVRPDGCRICRTCHRDAERKAKRWRAA